MESAEEQTTTVVTTATAAGGDDDWDDGHKDVTNVAKGKRTKRQRPKSPIRFTFSPSNNTDFTLVSSSGFTAGGVTAEDEETAESLILLSKGQSLDLSMSRKNKDDYDGIYKFNSKRYIQSSATGVAGMFVYECKTCSRTFPSFQALGGHRASHKKPRNNEEIRKPLPYTAVVENNEPFPPPPEYENHYPKNDQYYSTSSSISLQLNNNRVSFIGNTTKASSRLHECSICGTEFNSGQALGGHMRRHRVAGGGARNKGGYSNGTVNDINATALSLVPLGPVEAYDQKSNNDALCLGLDLNLPAPQTTGAKDNERQNRRFEFSPAGENDEKQQPAVHLSSAPTLVDCHY